MPGDISYTRLVNALQRDGWTVARQKKHCVLRKRAEGSIRWLVIPRHKPLRRSSLAKLLKEAGISVDRFLELL